MFTELGQQPLAAARQTLSYLNGTDRSAAAAEQLIDAARLLIFLKGNDPHDYKFSSAVLEDYYRVSPAWRNQYLALSMFKMRSSTDRDNRLVERILRRTSGVNCQRVRNRDPAY